MRHVHAYLTAARLVGETLADSVVLNFEDRRRRRGTVTTLASLYLDLPHYDRRAVDGVIVPAAAMRDVSQRLASLSHAGRVAVPCIGRDRADLVVAGCAILEAILDLWPARRLGVADRGIREGILRSLMAAERESERTLKALHKQRGNGASPGRKPA